MPQYQVIVNVKHVQGEHCFLVEAESDKEAVDIVRKGGGDLVSDELEITSYDWDNAEAKKIKP